MIFSSGALVRLTFLGLAIAVSGFAADLAGVWKGSLITPRGGRKSAVLSLKQEGSKVTGGFGGNDTDQRPIEKAKIEGDILSFEFDFGGAVRCELRLVGDRLVGEGKTGSAPTDERFKIDLQRSSK